MGPAVGVGVFGIYRHTPFPPVGQPAAGIDRRPEFGIFGLLL
jgi:hypothetical protein